MQVGGCDAHVGVPSRILDFGQGSTAGQGVADEGMPAVVDGKHLQPLGAEALAALLLSLDAQCERVPGDKEVA